MTAIVPAGAVVWGMQLPVQSQSTAFVQPWERESGPADLARIAVAADLAGAFYVAVCDHIAIPRPLDESMGAVWYDTVATLGWLAAQTESVNLLSHVFVVPYRAPLITAKAFATLDVLSGGRAILGVGIGHVEGEFELMGADFHQRGRSLDAALPIIREALSTGEYGGAIVSPRSPRPDGTPIWIGGSSEAALRRAATFGDGWLPQGPPKMGMRSAVEFLTRRRLETFGVEEPLDIGIQAEPIYVGTPTWDSGPFTLCGEPAVIAERLTKYAGVGANHIQVRFAARSADEMADQVAAFGADVWPLVGRE